jgi:HD superfamily phosphohydrolase
MSGVGLPTDRGSGDDRTTKRTVRDMNDTSRTPAKSNAVGFLSERLATIHVMAGCSLRLTRADTAVLHTRPLQRLVRLRQTGLAYMVWPSAENTRLSHSLGTLYWAWRLLESVRSNSPAGSGEPAQGLNGPDALQRMSEILGDDLSLDLLVRLFALTHDMALLPLGHTLQFQLGFYCEPEAQAARARKCLDVIREEIEDAPELCRPTGPHSRHEAVTCLRKHLDVVECVFGLAPLLHGKPWRAPERVSTENLARWLPVLTFVYDVNHATFSADMIDFVLRDSLAAAMPRYFDERLLESTCVFQTEAVGTLADLLPRNRHGARPYIYRFGLNAVRKRLRHEVITGAAALYRARYEIAERVFYHDTKCAADAMFDRALRVVDQRTGQIRRPAGPFAEDRLLQMGDDELLALVEAEEQRCMGRGEEPEPSRPAIMNDLLSRRLYREIFRVEDRSRLSPDGYRLASHAGDPAVRDQIEQRIVSATPGLAPSDIAFACRPSCMQAKKASMLIGLSDGRPQPLYEIAEQYNLGREVLEIHEQYARLWALSVYVRPRANSRADSVRQACRDMFGITEDQSVNPCTEVSC